MENCEILSKNMCTECGKDFKTVACRNIHIRRFHKKEWSDLSSKCKLLCPYPNCEFYYYRSNAMRHHICMEHKIHLEQEVITFLDKRAFFTWKGNIEKKNKCKYVSNRYAVQKKGADKSRMMWFNCIGLQNECSKENQQSLQEEEGKLFCPSTLKVTISQDKTFTVEYYKTHLGHNGALNDTVMQSEEDVDDPDVISEDVPFDQILDNVRESVYETELQRSQVLAQIDLPSKSDVLEQNNCGMLCSDDFNNVSMWVHKMNTLGEYSPVAFFKQKGRRHEKLGTNDFMIVICTKLQKEVSKTFLGNKICIDSICGENSYDFSLTSLLAIEESSRVFPIAFCISNKTDVDSMTVFFETVKENVGTYESTVFMSNGEPSFYIAWEKVMFSNNASPVTNLLCSWDIDRCWRKHLTEIMGEEEKIITYKTLRVLLEESDIPMFEEALDSFLDELRGDVSTNKFSEYFHKEYFLTPKLWAFCYRPDFCISSDVYLDAMHQTLKKYFFGGEKAKVCKAIQGLLKLTRHEVLRLPSDFIDNDLDCWFSKMSEGHQRSLKIVKTFASYNSCTWSVQTPENYKYSVVTKEATCSEECCLKCSVCNVCVHKFSCTCEDNLIFYNICQHIHACARLLESGPAADEKAVGQEKETSAIVQSTVSSNLNFDLREKLNGVKSMLDYEYSEQAAKQIDDTLDLLLSFMAKNKQA